MESRMLMMSIIKYMISGGCGAGMLAESLKCEDASFSNKFTPSRSNNNNNNNNNNSLTGESPVQDQLTNPGN